MQSEATHKSGGESRGNAVTTTCLNCCAAMPREMRFCRACGQRLGEGLAEYVETIRFDQSTRAAAGYVNQRAAASEYAPQREARVAHDAKNFGTRMAGDVVHGTLKGVEELFKNLDSAFKQNQVKLAAQTTRLPSFGCGGKAFRFNRRKDEASERSKKRGAHWLTWMSFWIVIGLFFTVFVNLTVSDSPRRNHDSRAATQARESVAAVRQKVMALREAALQVREEIIAGTNGARSVTSNKGGDGSLGLDDSDLALVAVPDTNTYGVQLGEVGRNSAAGLSGLREKDLLIEFDGAPVRSVEEFAARIKGAAPGSTIKAVVMRGAERLEIPVLVGQED